MTVPNTTKVLRIEKAELTEESGGFAGLTGNSRYHSILF
jgi:hypothetical protein